MENYSCEKVKEKLKSSRSPKSSDFSRPYQVSNSILKTISQPRNHLNISKKHRVSKSQSKFSHKSITQGGQSASIFDEGLKSHVNESAHQFLNTSINNTLTIEENFPRYLNQIEKSVSVLKKFYNDICNKKNVKPHYSIYNPSANSTQLNSSQKEDLACSKPDIETIQKEYESTYNVKTNDIRILYEFYSNHMINKSQKSFSLSNGIFSSNINSSMITTNQNHSIANDNHLALVPENCSEFERGEIPPTPMNSHRLFETNFDDACFNKYVSDDNIIDNVPKIFQQNLSNPQLIKSSKGSKNESKGINGFINNNSEQPIISKSTSNSPMDLKRRILTSYIDKKAMLNGDFKISQKSSTPDFEYKKKGFEMNKPIIIDNKDMIIDKLNQKDDSTQNLQKNKSNDEIFNKIFEKNMFINKIKQEINQNIQELADSSTKLKSQKILNFDELMNRAQGNESDIPEWINNESIKATDLNLAVIEKSNETPHLEQNSQNKISKQESSAGVFDDLLNLISNKNMHLNNDDLEVLNELREIAGAISNMSNADKIKELILKKDTNMIQFLKDKICTAEKFKKNKYYVQEIPTRKTKVVDAQTQNEEENKRNEKNLKIFYENAKVIDDLENILDNSNVINPDFGKPDIFLGNDELVFEIEEAGNIKESNGDLSFNLDFEINSNGVKSKVQNEKNVEKFQNNPDKSGQKKRNDNISSISSKTSKSSAPMIEVDPREQIKRLDNLGIKLRKVILILEKESKITSDITESANIKAKIKKYMKKKSQVDMKIQKYSSMIKQK